MKKEEFKKLLKRIWHFIWEEDSAASWIVNILLAFILIKFIVYPGLGLVLSTSHPIVAVVSESMEHETDFDTWWEMQGSFYESKNITKEMFEDFRFNKGFNKGDLMLLTGKDPEKLKKGDVLVYQAGKPDPIIHRAIDVHENNGFYTFETKGDNNNYIIVKPWLDERAITENQIIGKAVLRIPYVGYVKIWAVQTWTFVRGVFK